MPTTSIFCSLEINKYLQERALWGHARDYRDLTTFCMIVISEQKIVSEILVLCKYSGLSVLLSLMKGGEESKRSLGADDFKLARHNT